MLYKCDAEGSIVINLKCGCQIFVDVKVTYDHTKHKSLEKDFNIEYVDICDYHQKLLDELSDIDIDHDLL
jgi:hypothetical protein